MSTQSGKVSLKTKELLVSDPFLLRSNKAQYQELPPVFKTWMDADKTME